MYNSYNVSSSLFSLRSNGSVSFSFNDYSSNLLNSSLEKPCLSSSSPCSSCCCSCCGCCCATFTSHAHSITPCYLYGFRQSALVQCLPSRTRRLILPAPNRSLLRFPSLDLDASVIARKTRRRFRCMASQENNARYWLSGLDAAEAMISLLSEEVDEECLDAGKRNMSSHKIVEVRKKKSYDNECYRQKKKREQREKTRNNGCECSWRKKKSIQIEKSGKSVNELYREKNTYVRSGLSDGDSKQELESISIQSTEEGRRNAERESMLRAENRKERRKSSSCSSYYSLSSSDDLESDTELLEQEEQFVEESLNGHAIETTQIDKIRIEGQGTEVFKRDDAGGRAVDWDMRKKSEKKLAEVCVDDTQSGARYSEEYSRRVKNDESTYSSYKQLDDKDWKIRNQHTQMDNQVFGESESRRKKVQGTTERTNIRVSDARETSQEKQFTANKANVEVSEIQDTAERISTLQRRSESRMKIVEEDKTRSQSSFQQTRKQQQQRGERRQFESRRKSEFSSEINEDENENTSILQSDTHKMKGYDTLSSNFSFNTEAENQSFTKYQKPTQRVESGKGLQANITFIRPENIETGRDSQIGSGKRLIEPENSSASGVKLISDRSRRNYETTSRVEQMKSRNEEEKPSRVSSSWEKAEEASSSQVQQQSCVDEMESLKRNTHSILMPAQSQMIPGGLQHNASMTRISTDGDSTENSESGSAISYMHSRERSQTYGDSLNLTTQEDSLGSAQRLGESSLQFVGEFVEKARHDVLTSDDQQVRRSSDFNVAYETDKHGKNISSQYGKEDIKMQKHDSRQSSKGSGAKGPSDEMWDVADPSVQQPPKEETKEETSQTEQVVMKRSGRSLWSLMGDIIRLRWGSRSQTPSSAARSGGRTSPNESVESETWFSGREPEENSEENLRREKSSTASEVVHYQLGPGTQGEGDVSDLMRASDRIRQPEGIILPSSNMLETGSTSESTSLTSQKEKHDGSGFDVASSSKEVAQSSLPLPERGLRRSAAVEMISETDKIDIHEVGSVEAMEQPLAARLTEASGFQGKDGELKQRKFQRAKQVPRDRFDEWEEAYTLEREQRRIDELFMKEALLEAQKAADSWEVPVGAVLVQHGKIIARGRNLVEELRDSTAHAEMICIREASGTIRSWRLVDSTLYVTLEPCPMCAGAILQARIDTLVWGAPNKLLGADGSWIRLFPDGREGDGSELTDKPAAPVHPFHPKMTIRRGILASECADIMQQFFQLRRKKKEKNVEQPSPPSCLPITSHPSKFLTKMHDVFHMMFCL